MAEVTEEVQPIEVPAEIAERLTSMRTMVQAGMVSEDDFSKIEKEVLDGLKKSPAAPAETVDPPDQNAPESKAPAGKGEESQKTPEEIEAEKVAAKEAAKAAAEKKDPAPAPTEKKDILGLRKKTEKKGEVIVIEKPEDILSVVKTKYGQELKDIKDLPKFFESVDKFRTASQKVDTLEKENQTLRELWEEKLPAEFIEAAQAYLRGEDYKSVLVGKQAKFDFKLPAEKQDVKALVNHYFPNKFKDEDFSETEHSDALEIAKQASVDKYKIEKQAFDSQSASLAQSAKKKVEAQRLAAAGSIEHLKRNFPEVDSDVLGNIKKIIEGGPASVLSQLYNNDGTAKPEAAERLMMALHGKDYISDMMELAGNQRETQVNEEILKRGPSTPKPAQKSSAPAPQISEETKKAVDTMERIAEQSQLTF